MRNMMMAACRLARRLAGRGHVGPAALRRNRPAHGWTFQRHRGGYARPDLAIISAGVVDRQATARAQSRTMRRGWSECSRALKQAGIADRDIQTSSINLNPEYRYQDNQAPQLAGYTASNQVTIRFRDIRNSGKSSMRWSPRAPIRSTARH